MLSLDLGRKLEHSDEAALTTGLLCPAVKMLTRTYLESATHLKLKSFCCLRDSAEAKLLLQSHKQIFTSFADVKQAMQYKQDYF